MTRGLAGLLTLFILSSSCSRPHPLAEWSPDAFAPETPDRTWSTAWWPEGTGDSPPVPAAPQPVFDLEYIESPLTLASTLDIALSANPDTRVAWANARAAAAEFGVKCIYLGILGILTWLFLGVTWIGLKRIK